MVSFVAAMEGQQDQVHDEEATPHNSGDAIPDLSGMSLKDKKKKSKNSRQQNEKTYVSIFS